MAFTAKDVAELRKQTGCGMMDCKKALTDANGDFEAAIKILREKGMAAVAKKADRIAAEGIVDILTIDNTTAMIEVNSETDFVAKNAIFQQFVKDLLKTIIVNKPADVDALMSCNIEGEDEGTVSDALASKTGTIGEKLSIRRFVIVEGVVATYIHNKGETGVIINFVTDLDAAAIAECGKNVALQVAAMPVLYLNK
ncbi:MAG: translation elongation factor Ts, partial [Ruminococcaceae bacterium]|nr:translation elongation factor Ts [Oscillospiraceae bacterium]